MLSTSFLPLFGALTNALVLPNTQQADWAIAPPPRYFITFGDSYSQSGFNTSLAKPSINNPFGNPPFPGWTTVANGVNWVGEAGVVLAPNNTLVYNFAYGGATVNASLATGSLPHVLSFIDQVSSFSSILGGADSSPGPPARHAPWRATNSAFAIWFGVNDIGTTFDLADPAFPVRNQQILDSYFGQVDVLYRAGGRRFVFINVPPTNRTPLFISQGANTTGPAAADVADWNHVLVRRAARWGAARPDARYRVVDAHAVFTAILDSPASYGAPNATCYDASATKCLWWNDYHPGAAISQGVGKVVSLALQSLGFYDNGLW